MASLKKQMQVVQKLIKLQRFDEARDVLMTIKHKKAQQMLKAINKKSPESDDYTPADDDDDEDDRIEAAAAGSPNLVFIFTSLLLLIAILSGGVVASNEPVNLLTASTVVEDDCGAQNWYRETGGAFADMINFSPFDLLFFDFNSNLFYVDQEIRQSAMARMQQRITELETFDTPECAKQAEEYLLAALNGGVLAAERFNLNDPGTAFFQMGVMLDNMLLAATEMQSLNVRLFGQDNFAVDMLTDPNCPAYEWAIRNMYLDNQFLRMVFLLEDIYEGANYLDSLNNYASDLRQQEVGLMNNNPPPCLGAARGHMLEAIADYTRMFEAATGGDAYGIQLHYENSLDDLELFYIELESVGLDPLQFGRGYMLGY